MSILGDGINAFELINKSIKDINLAFGFKVIDNTNKDNGIEARLVIINLDDIVAPLVIKASDNISIKIPINSEETCWDQIDDSSYNEKIVG